MHILGLPFRQPGWSAIGEASLVGMLLVITISFVHASGAIDATTARAASLGGVIGIALRAYGVDADWHRWRSLGLVIANGIPLYAGCIIVANLTAG